MENMNKGKGLVHTVCILAVICMFGISAMMLGSVGASVYKNIAERNLDSFELKRQILFSRTYPRTLPDNTFQIFCHKSCCTLCRYILSSR